MSSQESLSKTIRRAAKVALGKEPSKVQKYIMSGKHLEILKLMHKGTLNIAHNYAI